MAIYWMVVSDIIPEPEQEIQEHSDS